MGTVCLEISDAGNRLLLRTLLQGAGHRVGEAGELLVTDNLTRAVEAAKAGPVLVLTPAGGVGEAVRAMEQGVFGYILLPLHPGEAQLMAARALSQPGVAAPVPEHALRPLAEVEREHILAVLRACRQNQAKAARVLGIGRNTLWRKLRSYAIPQEPQ